MIRSWLWLTEVGEFKVPVGKKDRRGPVEAMRNSSAVTKDPWADNSDQMLLHLKRSLVLKNISTYIFISSIFENLLRNCLQILNSHVHHSNYYTNCVHVCNQTIFQMRSSKKTVFLSAPRQKSCSCMNSDFPILWYAYAFLAYDEQNTQL